MQFINYFKTVIYAPRPKSTPVALWIAGYFIFFFGIYVGKEFITSLAFLAGIVMCYYFSSTPNMETVFPVNHRKKLVYRFSSSLLMFALMLAFALAVMAVIFIIVLIAVSISEGGLGWITQTVPEEGDIPVEGMGLYGGLFIPAYFITMYSAGMITGFIKKRKTRNIWLFSLCAVVAGAFVLMSVPYILNGGIGLTSPFSRECYDAMSLPWLSTVLWFIIAAGALGTAIYMGIRYYDPKKF